MAIVVKIAQVVIALGIFNVWFLRFGKPTAWRGGNATTMREEFAAYGLPPWFVFVIGFLKVALAVCLIAGLWVPWLARAAAVGMAVLMGGAIAMHVKAGDPPKKSLPAFAMLVLSVFVALFAGGLGVD